jgi:cytochrome oxidase Cu insertion factor (SCO1/SenC/PrrC family)
MTLYSKGGQYDWRVLPREEARRLEHVSRLAIAILGDGDSRADALVAMALAEYSAARRSGRRSRANADARRKIEDRLREVRERYPRSERYLDATIGLIHLAAESDRIDEARLLYDDLQGRQPAGTNGMARIRDALGPLALRLEGLPAFEATTLDGETVGPSSLAGKVVLLDFWATWCAPCVDELNRMRKIRGALSGDDRFEIVGVSLDHEDDLTAVRLREWLARREIDWPQIYEGQGWESELARSFRVREIPFTVLVGADGAIVGVDLHGKALKDAARSAVDAAVRRAGRVP